MVRGLVAAVASVVVFVGCQGVDSADGVASQRIGASGGTVTHAKGASLRVPSGALASELTFTVSEAPAGTPLPNALVMGPAFVYGPEGATFSTPLTVVLPIELPRLPQGRSLTDIVVMTAQSPGDPYTLLPTRLSDATHVEADTNHFSIFVPVILSSAAGDGGTYDGGSGTDAGDVDGGACSESCATGNDGGADCQCTQTCGATTIELLCSGSGPFGCACVENGRQTNVVTLTFCPGPGSIDSLCRTVDGGVDGGLDGGPYDGGVDGGPYDGGSDGGYDAGIDGGPYDGGSDGGIDGGPYDGGSDGGIDGGPYDGGADGGVDGGPYDGGADGGVDGGPYDGGADGGIDGGAYDGGVDAGVDGGSDAGTPDAGANDGG